MKGLLSKLGDQLRFFVSTGLPVSLAGGLILLGTIALAVPGFPELASIPFGGLPSSPSGILALTLALSFAGYFACLEMGTVRHLRDRRYVIDMHGPSIWFSFAVGVLAAAWTWFVSTWKSSGLDPLIAGISASALTFLIVGRPWAAITQAEWIRRNAHVTSTVYYLLEGSHDRKTWHAVARIVPDGLTEARSQAQNGYRFVRYWRIEALTSLYECSAGGGLVVSSPVEAKTFSSEDVDRALRALT
jgi:hypothetical protein